jgi:hypothetical protein
LAQEIEEARNGVRYYMELYAKKKNENEMAHRSFLYLLEE